MHGLCVGLVELGHKVTVFTTNVDGDSSLPEKYSENYCLDGVTVNYYRCGIGRRLYRSPDLAAALTNTISKFDVVHLHSVFLWPTFKAARLACKSNVPYVVSPRGMLVSELIRKRGKIRKSLWIAIVENRTLERAAMVHVTSSLEQERLKEFDFRLRKVVVVPNGVFIPEACEEKKECYTASATPIILYLGRVNWKKGLDRLIDCIPHVNSNCRFVIAGNESNGYKAILQSCATKIGVEDRIQFVGEVNDDNKWALLSQSAVVVLPSYQENFGNVVLEAMAASRPVVVTPEVGAAPIVKKAGAGIVTTGDPIEIASALDKLLINPTLCKEMGSRGQGAISKDYEWKNVAGHMAEHYRDIIARDRS